MSDLPPTAPQTPPVDNCAGGAEPTAMTPGRWQQVKAILQAALDLPPAERPGFVAGRCGVDAALRTEVEGLLAAAARADNGTLVGPDAVWAVAALAGGLGAGPAPGDTATADSDPATADVGGRLATALAGRYDVERQLGRGGMATVYLARDLRHKRLVAVKVLHPHLGALVDTERFRREVETAAGLSHPHILPLHDSGEAGGLLYYVMPYVAGESLRERLRRTGGPLRVADVLRVVGEIADALDHAHRRGVVHRDVKPENILLDEDGHAVVADFGIARALRRATPRATRRPATPPTLTQTGAFVGTPAYMSPEQALSEPALDGRSDVYSLGCVAYELLAGAPPFAGSTAEQLAQRLRAPPPPLTARRPDLPAHVDAVLARALAVAPAARFPTATAFVHALAARARRRPRTSGPARAFIAPAARAGRRGPRGPRSPRRARCRRGAPPRDLDARRPPGARGAAVRKPRPARRRLLRRRIDRGGAGPTRRHRRAARDRRHERAAVQGDSEGHRARSRASWERRTCSPPLCAGTARPAAVGTCGSARSWCARPTRRACGRSRSRGRTSTSSPCRSAVAERVANALDVALW